MKTPEEVHKFYMKIYDCDRINNGFVNFKFKNGTSKRLWIKSISFDANLISKITVATVTTFEQSPVQTVTYNLDEIEDVS